MKNYSTLKAHKCAGNMSMMGHIERDGTKEGDSDQILQNLAKEMNSGKSLRGLSDIKCCVLELLS